MRKPLQIVLIILMFLFVISFSLTPLRSTNDAWWHLKTGKILIERGLELPENDIFAFTSENIPWHNHEWLSQILFYKVFQLGDGTAQGGMRMVIGFKAIILLALSLLVFMTCFRETKNLPISVICAVWTIILTRRTIYPRPPILTYPLFALFLLILREIAASRWKRGWLWILPPLMILWVNLHGGFMLGLIAIGAFLAGEAWKNLRSGKPVHGGNVKAMAALFVACILASLVNPYSWRLYLLPGRVMSDALLVRIIPELQSPKFFYTVGFELLILFLIVAFSGTRKGLLNLPEGLLMVFFLHQALLHVRHIPLFGIVAAPVAARVIAALIEEYRPRAWTKTASDLVVGGIALLVISYTVFNHREGESFFDRNYNFSRGMGYYPGSYPVQEADFIIANEFTGRMYNQINDAGYLIWRLSPEHHKVFTDSRYDIFGGRFMRHEQMIQQAIDRKVEPGDRTWDELLDFWEINFILISGDIPLRWALDQSDEWTLVYHRLHPDAQTTREGYKIYIRNIPGNRDLIDRCKRSFHAGKARGKAWGQFI